MKSLLDRFRPIPTRETVELTISQSGQDVEVSLGRRSFAIRTNSTSKISTDTYDFALLGAMALSLTHNISIKTDLPISRGASEKVREFQFIMELWQPRKIYLAPIICKNIVDMPPSDAAGNGIICLSGGADSTYAAIESLADHKLTHGVLIAGADYPSSKHPGFINLKSRVDNIAAKLGLELLVVETSIRQLGLQWEMLHGAILAMTLNLHQSQFSHGVIAADQSAEEELAHHPWGNTRVTTAALSNGHFPIHHVGWEYARSAKVRRILSHPSDIISDLSVCYQDQTTGGNCGHCSKCIRTRLNILTTGQQREDLFESNPPLEDLIPRMKSSPHQARKRKELARLLEIRRDLPESSVKDALALYIETLERKIAPTGRR